MSADDEFTLAATGDSIITRSVLPSAERDDRFAAVLDRLAGADATVTNLETVVVDDPDYATPPRPVRDQFQYLGSFPGLTIRSRSALLDELDAMGIDLYAAASNHSFDFGRRGMASTMAALETRSLPYAGLGRDLPDARAAGYATTPGGRVGLVAATTSVAPGSEAGRPSQLLDGRPGVSPLHVNWTYRATAERVERLAEVAEAVGIDDVAETWRRREDADAASRDGLPFMHMTFEAVDDEADEGIQYSLHEADRRDVLGAVEEANEAAEWVVASVHAHQGPAGTRNVSDTPDFLVDFARSCIDAGADAFVGTGPHVLRGVELYRGKPIFYSLGNFFCQFETLDRLPAESFEYYGVDDDRYPSAVFDARYYEDGEPAGNLADPAYWRTVVPTCRFGPDGDVRRVELLPCTLGRERERSRRGTPVRASEPEATEIIEEVRALSEPFGTTIGLEERGDEGTIGVVDPV